MLVKKMQMTNSPVKLSHVLCCDKICTALEFSDKGIKQHEVQRSNTTISTLHAIYERDILMFVRYGLTGAVATACHYIILLCLVELLSVQTWAAAGFGAFFGAVVAYFGNRKFTFNSAISQRQSLPRFFMIAGLAIAMNSSLVWLITHYFNLYYFVAQLIATVIVLVVTYQLNKQWTFA